MASFMQDADQSLQARGSSVVYCGYFLPPHGLHGAPFIQFVRGGGAASLGPAASERLKGATAKAKGTALASFATGSEALT